MSIQHFVEFEPIGRRGLVPEETSLLETARLFGVDLTGDCGGFGVCGSCQVKVVEGEMSDITDNEDMLMDPDDLDAGYRLACMTHPESDCKITIPPESLDSPMHSQVEGQESVITLRSAISGYDLRLPPPSIEHPLADADVLLAALPQSGMANTDIDLGVLHTLSDDLRAFGWQVRTSIHQPQNEVIAVRPAGSGDVGLAVDLGSTGVAGYLVDLVTGETLAAKGMMNPQISYGEDIISRISYAAKTPNGLGILKDAIVDGLNQLTKDLCKQAGIDQQDVLDAVIVGNTAMHHLLLGLPLNQLALSPFVPAISRQLDLKARDIGLILAPGAYVHIPPNIAGFVGSDHVAMLMATADQWLGKTAIALDIGTNTEISLITADGAIASVSCASGPAFEGYQIKDGTRAKAGAIERIRITPTDVSFDTIDNAPPLGICGSGIVDAVAQLQLSGVVSANGRIGENAHPNVRNVHGERVFLLVDAYDERRPITITQDDVREIQLAKSSIQTGMQLLLAELDVDLADIEIMIIAGAFGSYIDVPNALAIGMFPSLPLDHIVQVGNAAGAGARQALLSTDERQKAQAMVTGIQYLELATHPKFSRAFARNCNLHPYAH